MTPPVTPGTSRPVPRWVPPATLALTLAGLGDAAYLTFEHYTGSTTLACSANGIVDCAAVTRSPYAVIAGVPVALLGLVFFVAMAGICLPVAWRVPALDRLRIGLASLGVVSVLYLIFVELFRLDRICLWCTGIHVVTVVLFAVIALVAPQRVT